MCIDRAYGKVLETSKGGIWTSVLIGVMCQVCDKRE